MNGGLDMSKEITC